MLVSTPYMDEAGRCDRVALIDSGKILEIDTPQRIVEGFGSPCMPCRERICLECWVLHGVVVG